MLTNFYKNWPLRGTIEDYQIIRTNVTFSVFFTPITEFYRQDIVSIWNICQQKNFQSINFVYRKHIFDMFKTFIYFGALRIVQLFRQSISRENIPFFPKKENCGCSQSILNYKMQLSLTNLSYILWNLVYNYSRSAKILFFIFPSLSSWLSKRSITINFCDFTNNNFALYLLILERAA